MQVNFVTSKLCMHKIDTSFLKNEVLSMHIVFFKKKFNIDILEKVCASYGQSFYLHMHTVFNF